MTETVLGDRLFVGGEWVEASATGETFDVVNPANGEVLATLPDGGREDMRRAIDAAAEVQREWGETTAVYRAGILREAARLMHERKEHLAKVMTLEQGKPLAESRGEIGYAASFVEWFAEEGKRVYGETIPASFPDKRLLVIKRPVGVTAAITPWNFPAAMITRKLAPPSPPAARR
jgi:succinate-semialdehyde dehydrogenase / glutarate-semialdehyde dehydrogenase